ncbi:MAG: O-antigen ligase family protein [Patescibacteria group bacterium]
MENNLMLDKNLSLLKRFLIIIVPFFLFLIIFNQININIILGIFLLILAYFLFKDYLWIFLVLAIPSLVFGEIVNISITSSWVYEARVAEVLLLTAVIIFLSEKFISAKIKEIKVDKLVMMLFFFLLISVALIYQITDFRLYIFGLKVTTFSFLAYFLSINLIDSKEKIKWFLYSLSATAFIVSAQIFYKFYELGWSSKFFFARHLIEIPIGPIALASAILVLMLPIILSLYFQEDKNNKIKPFLLIIFLVGLVAVFISLGKAAILSLAIGLFYLFIKIKDKRIVFILFFLLFIILSFIMLSPFFSGLIERLSTTFTDVNTEFRLLEYETGWKIIKNNLVFGIGPGQQLLVFKKMLNLDSSQLVNNYFLQAAIDLGIIGLSLAVLITFNIYFKARRLRKYLENNLILVYGFVASLIVAFINGLAEVTFFAMSYAIIFWLIVGAFNNLRVFTDSDYVKNKKVKKYIHLN